MKAKMLSEILILWKMFRLFRVNRRIKTQEWVASGTGPKNVWGIFKSHEDRERNVAALDKLKRLYAQRDELQTGLDSLCKEHELKAGKS